jgi:hypothetical protein
MPYGGVYSKVSAASMANPSNAGALALIGLAASRACRYLFSRGKPQSAES